MARPFISYTWSREPQMEWLRDFLVSLGFESPIVVHGGHPQAPLERVKNEMKQADCFFALVSPETSDTGEVLSPDRAAPWVHDELAAAITLGLPIGAIWEPGLRQGGMLPAAFTWHEVNFSSPTALLSAVPAIARMALHIKQFVDQDDVDARKYPFVYNQVRVINKVTPSTWEQYRSIRITARTEVPSTEHSIEAPDQSAGVSIQLDDPESHLSVTSKDRPSLAPQVTRNDATTVAYRLVFDPPLYVGESIQYRHWSRHRNPFPMTHAEVLRSSAFNPTMPWLKSGLVGDFFTVTRPTSELILEFHAPSALGFSSPEVRVYADQTAASIDDETKRIGNPTSAPGLWRVDENVATDEWQCAVTIKKPLMGCSYCLLVRPPKARAY